MPGKAYTLREMKLIVDYIKDNSLYSEVRGRKMWMAFASTKIIDRTWQSAKETFLKRILTDIHQPYYKLTRMQIRSFRACCDQEAKYNNKLEIQHLSSNEETKKEDCPPSTSKNEGNAGEDIKCSKIQSRNRSSTDTLVLENCYDITEDIQNEVKSPSKDEEKSVKSLRDCITYAEPLTPMLQEVMDDFATDDEEPQLQIVENEINNEDKDKSDNADKDQSGESSTNEIRVSQSLIEPSKQADKMINGKYSDARKPASKIKSLKLKKTRKGTWENKEASTEDDENEVSLEKDNEKNNNADSDIVLTSSEKVIDIPGDSTEEMLAKNDHKSLQSVSNTTDTQLPNNQEAYGNKLNPGKQQSNEESAGDFQDVENKKNKKDRKRNRSQASTERKQIKKKPKDSDIQGKDGTEASVVLVSNCKTSKDQKSLECVQKDNADDNCNVEPTEKPGKTNQQVITEIHNTNTPSSINPCLESVSLYAEQFSQSKYSDTDSGKEGTNEKTKEGESYQVSNGNHATDNNAIENKTKTPDNQTKVPQTPGPSNALSIYGDKGKDILLLNSHTDTSSEAFESPPKMATPVKRTNKSRERALASVFGFSIGKVSRNRRRTISNRSKSSRQDHRRVSTNRHANKHLLQIRSDSSDDYTTDDDSEDLSRPQRRSRNILNRYEKPKPYDLLTNQEGSLFVVGRNKIYPIITRDGNDVNYACWPDNDDDGQESHWKLKYFEERQKCAEEKIRADELARLLARTTERLNAIQGAASPILQSVASKTTTQNTQQPVKDNSRAELEQMEAKPSGSSVEKRDKKVKIKFNKDKEIEFECDPSQMEPVLEKMAYLFKKDEPKVDVKEVSKKVDEIKVEQILSSGKSTPVPADPEVREKVDKLESEIFKEIEERDKTEQVVANTQTQENNVTKRRGRGRPKKVVEKPLSISSTSSGSHFNTVKKVLEENSKKTIAKEKTEREFLTDTETKRRTRLPKRYSTDNQIPVARLRSRITDSSRSLPVRPKKDIEIPDDSQVRYMLPPTKRFRSESLTSTKKSNQSYYKSREISSTDSSTFSIESSHFYQDSDTNSPLITLRRKKKTSLTKLLGRNELRRNNTRSRKSDPYLADNDTNEAISFSLPAKTVVRNLSLDTQVYRSESYELLKPQGRSISQLCMIDKNIMTEDETAVIKHSNNLSSLTIQISNEHDNYETQKLTEGNSSNVSLPMSPEISIVENITVRKDLLKKVEHPSINETQCNLKSKTLEYEKYSIRDVDTSMPLMEQDCEIRQTLQNNNKSTVTESLLNKIVTVNIENATSDSLAEKLGDLLLESAKKIAMQFNNNNIREKNNLMEVDADVSKEPSKSRSKKRCSTPRKKTDKKKSKRPAVDPVLEEHIVLCSRGGRKSCPPIINTMNCENELEENLQLNDSTELTAKNKSGGRRKKDVIKVKITRPKTKEKRSKDKNKSRSRQSICTDSGINETESEMFLHDMNDIEDDSVELIHNHSETCLHANECIGDSIEFIETSNNIISLDSSLECNCQDKSEEHFETPEMFCTDAKDAFNNEIKVSTQELDIPSNCGSVYHSIPSPVSSASFSSLMTNDLSDETPGEVTRRQTKWYLLNEDETSSILESHSQNANSSFSTNLKQIFPLTYAIPDLSTITEASKENDSRKPSFAP